MTIQIVTARADGLAVETERIDDEYRQKVLIFLSRAEILLLAEEIREHDRIREKNRLKHRRRK